VKVQRHRGGRPPAVRELGVGPTITASGRAVLEVHLFDFSGNLYEAHVRVEFLHKIRDEEKYPDLETLKTRSRATVKRQELPHGSPQCLKPTTRKR